MRVRVDTSAAEGGRRWRVQRRQPQNVVYDGPSRSVLYTSTFWSAEAPLVDYTLMMSRTQKNIFSRCWHRSLLKRPKYDDYTETRLQLALRIVQINIIYCKSTHGAHRRLGCFLSSRNQSVYHVNQNGMDTGHEKACASPAPSVHPTAGCSIRTPRALKTEQRVNP